MGGLQRVQISQGEDRQNHDRTAQQQQIDADAAAASAPHTYIRTCVKNLGVKNFKLIF